MYSIEFDINGCFACGLMDHLPDLMVTVNNIPNSQSNIFTIRKWLIEKVGAMTDLNSLVQIFILVQVKNNTKPVSTSSKLYLITLAAEPLFLEEEFGVLSGGCSSFSPVIAKEIQWIDVKAICFKVFLHTAQGMPDFESSDSIVNNIHIKH
ncbi:hypothetical protein L210DRAFT_3499205 [Boletus edulis BED1]|uniref:Uncharacterized protein n=1 Tax=Boletus edulis BED1 TaxID=1328754 RepID=A0AAD4C8F9_BOLED|nr:hypothetical protein L210DRAFT_3499205 [Boletus edulis BED1]